MNQIMQMPRVPEYISNEMKIVSNLLDISKPNAYPAALEAFKKGENHHGLTWLRLAGPEILKRITSSGFALSAHKLTCAKCGEVMPSLLHNSDWYQVSIPTSIEVEAMEWWNPWKVTGWIHAVCERPVVYDPGKTNVGSRCHRCGGLHGKYAKIERDLEEGRVHRVTVCTALPLFDLANGETVVLADTKCVETMESEGWKRLF